MPEAPRWGTVRTLLRRAAMDPRTFDRIVAAAASPPTRRQALRMLAGGVLAGLLPGVTRAAQRSDRDQDGLFDDDETDVYGTNPDISDTDGDGSSDGEEVYYGTDPLVNANAAPAPEAPPDPVLITCSAVGVPCDSDFQCCAGTLCCWSGVSLSTRCTDVSATGWVCPGDTPIPAGGCGAGLVDCADGRGCVDLASDGWNCGACGVSCGLNQYCSGGTCVGLTCFDGTVDCGLGSCVDLQSNFYHCGSCGRSCPNETSCVNGQCIGGNMGGGGGDSPPSCDKEYKEPFGEPPPGEPTCDVFD